MLAVVAGTLLGLSLLAAGMLLGMRLARRPQSRAACESISEARSEQVVQALLQWTHALVGDVDACQKQIAEIQQGALSVEGEAQPSAEAFVDMMSQMIQANAHMRQRLTVAEDALAEQARRIAQTLNEARTDALTGLPNRRMFDEELTRRHAEFRRHGTQYGLLIFDIDHFKRFNDTHGHLAGDEVLRNIARVVGHTLRESDMLARLGGEEFAVLFSGTPAQQCRAAAERMRSAVAVSVTQYEGQPMQVSVSCGLAAPLHGESARDVFDRSDKALYASKHGGRNCGHWHDGIRCVRLGEEPGADGPAATIPSDSELAVACDVLRQRLLEVTADK